MDLKEIQRVIVQSSSRLLQMSTPPVRYWLMTQVKGMSEDEAQVEETVRLCKSYPPKLKLLEKLRPDGTWPIPKHKKAAEDKGPGPPLGWTYRTILWNLSTLADYKASREEGNVNAALENMLRWQCGDGYIPGPWTDAFPLPYFNGKAANILLRFGLEKDERVQELLEWLLSMQRPDGGWNIPYLQDLKYLPEFKFMKLPEFIKRVKELDKSQIDLKRFSDVPSCHWSTLMVIGGLIDSTRHAKSKEVRRGADFVLDRFFKRNAHVSYYLTEKHWTALRYPIPFGNGEMALDILTTLGYGPDDSRMQKPISWLIGARSSNGLWSQSERPHPDRDQWISLTALRTLARFVRNK